MNSPESRHVYGPVPSRRLGRSLGVDLVPFKTCTYDCIYCQLGRTTCRTTDRKEYIPVHDIVPELQQKLAGRPSPDFVTLAGSGEPTLHSGIGQVIREIKRLTSIPVVVLTNGSLLWMPEVQEGLLDADLVIPSLDAGSERSFRRVNRPHPSIGFEKVVQGIGEFKARFQKRVWLEVFLVAGVTGLASEIAKIAAIAARIRPDRVQLNTVSRPPSEAFAHPVPVEQMDAFVGVFGGKAEVICEGRVAESELLSSTAGTDDDILALLSRRPCTAEGVSAGLGLHIAEATKRLQSLTEQGRVLVRRKTRNLFYEIRRMT
jgi:wyosine [tRNA(Phe)-imidazoG37] synthetase (radical SAM superfamily)